MASKIEYDTQGERIIVCDGDGIVKYAAVLNDKSIISAEGVWNGGDREALAKHTIDAGRATFSVADDFKSATVALVAIYSTPYGKEVRDSMSLRADALSTDSAIVAKLRADVEKLRADLSGAQASFRADVEKLRADLSGAQASLRKIRATLKNW